MDKFDSEKFKKFIRNVKIHYFTIVDRDLNYYGAYKHVENALNAAIKLLNDDNCNDLVLVMNIDSEANTNKDVKYSMVRLG